MKRMFCLAVLALVSNASMSVAAPIQWRIDDGGNGHWYEVKTASPHISWFDARDAAVSSGGYLATITSPEENAFIWNGLQIGTTEAYWADFYDGPMFGGYRQDTNAPWQWVTGEAWDYSNFNWTTQGGFAGAQFIAHSSFWDDLPPYGGSAGGNISYIVEYNAPAPSACLTVLGGVLLNTRRRRAGA